MKEGSALTIKRSIPWPIVSIKRGVGHRAINRIKTLRV